MWQETGQAGTRIYSSPRNSKSSSSVFEGIREPGLSSAQSTESLTLQLRPAPAQSCGLCSYSPSAVRLPMRPRVANCAPFSQAGDRSPPCRCDSLWLPKAQDRKGCHEVVVSASSIYNGGRSWTAKDMVVSAVVERDRPTLTARTEDRVNVVSRIWDGWAWLEEALTQRGGRGE